MKNTLNTIDKPLLVTIHFSLQKELKVMEKLENEIKSNYETYKSVINKVVFRKNYFWIDKKYPVQAFGPSAFTMDIVKISDAKKLLDAEVIKLLTVKKTYYKYVKKGGDKN